MIAGHIGFGNIFDQIIHAFNMPMFLWHLDIAIRLPKSLISF